MSQKSSLTQPAQAVSGALTADSAVINSAYPNFSIVQREDGWFWCSDAAWETRGTDALIGPFASRDEAEQDANEALGIVGNGRA
jgi:hypothetical protein